MIVVVTLTRAERAYVRFVGRMRQEDALARGRTSNLPAAAIEFPDLDAHVLGAGGECAFCKWRGVYWHPTIGDVGRPDVAPDIDVKTTKEDRHCLRVPLGASADWRYVLATRLDEETYQMRGWCYGREAKVEQFKRDPHDLGKPAYFVPPFALRNPLSIEVSK